MSAPAAVTQVTAQIAALQAQLNVLTYGPSKTATTSASTGSTTASASAFASELARSTPSTVSTTAAATTGGAVTGASVVADAQQYLGTPYVWGAESNSGMDCSGLTQKTFGDLGVKLPRTAAEQSHVGTPVASLAQAQPGDLLFFGDPAYHVAIYAGNNQLIESPEPGKTVHITDVYQTPTSIRRMVPSAGSVSSTLPVTTTSATGGLSATQLTAAGLNPAVAAYASQFAAAEQAHGLPSGLLAAVAQQESGGNASAVSSAGAQGLMQLMPSTASGLGADPFDPQQAIAAAAQIFQRNLAHFNGSVPLALAAYNAGTGAVDKYGGVPPYTETQNYVTKISAMLAAGG